MLEPRLDLQPRDRLPELLWIIAFVQLVIQCRYITLQLDYLFLIILRLGRRCHIQFLIIIVRRLHVLYDKVESILRLVRHLRSSLLLGGALRFVFLLSDRAHLWLTRNRDGD